MIHLIINAGQTGYINNRFIGLNLRQIEDVIDYADKFNLKGSILFIDFSKAFNTLEWNFMYHTFEYFGFNSTFINWIKTLYTNIDSSIFNTGWISTPFRPLRGIRQECPCSSFNFVNTVEIIANHLRQNKNIRCIELKIERWA